jgi:hypothetical protein
MPKRQEPIDWISVPNTANEGWSVQPPYGAETFILLARDEPLPRDIDVQGMLQGLPRQHVKDLRRAIWFANGKPLSQSADRLRGIDVNNSTPIDDSLLNAHRMIQEGVQSYFDMSRGVSFASRGEEQ